MPIFLVQESESQVLTVPLGQGSAPFNPRSQLLPVSPSASVSVPNGTFKSGKTSRTCILSLQVSVPYRVNNKGVTKRGKKKKKAGEFIADAAADENGMFCDRPSHAAYHTTCLLNYWVLKRKSKFWKEIITDKCSSDRSAKRPKFVSLTTN